MSFFQVPPDSTGKKVYTREHTVGPDSVHSQVVHLACGDRLENFARIDERGSLSVRFAEGQPSLDVFGGLRVSQSVLALSYEFTFDPGTNRFTDSVVGGGAATYQPTMSSVRLSVDGANGSKITRSSTKIVRYQPGAGLRYDMTCYASDAGRVGNTRRWGMFDQANGIFFELTDELAFVVRSSVSGSVVERRFTRDNWIDPLDGTGISGFDLDVTKLNIYWMDYQWLGAGVVRFGVIAPDGSRLVVGRVENANQFSHPYMQTGSSRICHEVENTALTGATSELTMVCGSVRYDGVAKSARFFFSDLQRMSTPVAGVNTPIMSVRPKALYNGNPNRAVMVPGHIDAYATQPMKIDFHLGAVLDGATWAVQSRGGMEADIAATAFLGGLHYYATIIDAGHTRIPISDLLDESHNGLNLWADGTQPVMCATATPIGAAGELSTVLTYAEIY